MGGVLGLMSRGIRLLARDPARAYAKAARYFRPMRADYRRRYRMSLRSWLLRHQQGIVFDQCTWMGLPMYKDPMDSWIYQELLYKVKPDVLVEIGSAEGGSTLYFANLMDLIGRGEVISIDIDRSKFKASHGRIVTFTGDSSSDEIVSAVAERCLGKVVMVVHDGDHSKGQVLKDLGRYAPLVSPGSYLVVEDGIMDLFRPGDGIGTFEDGPLAAVEEFLRGHPEFAVDEKCERYLLTYNPRGFLRRSAA